MLAQPKDVTPGSADDGKVAAGAYKTDLIPIRTWGPGCGWRIVGNVFYAMYLYTHIHAYIHK